MNLVAGLVRGKKVNEALSQLKFTPKKGAEILYKVLQSALSNATNNFAQDADTLVIKSILVTKGITYKRGIPVSRGRYHPILKRNSNIVVEIGLLEPVKTDEASKSEAKKAPKATTTAKEEVKEDTKKAEKKPASKKAPAKKAETAKKEKTESAKDSSEDKK